MAIANQRPCQVDGVPVALGDFCYTLNSNGAFQKYYCTAHWPNEGIAELNSILQSSSYTNGITRYLVFDDSVM